MHTSSFPHTASHLTRLDPILSHLPVGVVWDLQHTLMADAKHFFTYQIMQYINYHFYYRVSNSFQPLTPVQSPLQSALYGIAPARPKMLSIVLVVSAPDPFLRCACAKGGWGAEERVWRHGLASPERRLDTIYVHVILRARLIAFQTAFCAC